MNTVNANLSVNKLSNQTVVFSKLDIKGATTLNLVLTAIPEVEYKVAAITIDWGDNSQLVDLKRDLFFNYKTQSIFDEILYGRLGGSVLTVYSHDYTNDTNIYSVNYTPAVTLFWEDGTYTRLVQPIGVFWGSFYDDVGELNVLSTQIQPVSTNLTFVNLESKKDKTTLIGYLGTSGKASVVSTLTSTVVSPITSV